MHDPRSKTKRTQNELSGLGLKAYLRHTAAKQPRPAALILCVVCSIGQLTLYITRYSFLFACIDPSHIPCHTITSFDHAISILQSQ